MFSEAGSILMLHRVAPYEKGKIIYNEDMKISPDELRSVIGELRSLNRTFISLDELVNLSRKKRKYDRKFIVFTLDDGYKDNLEYAYPIFKEFNIPFCIYVTNSFPNKTTNLWWYALEELVLTNGTLLINSVLTENNKMESKERNFMFLRGEILTKHFENPLAFLSEAGSLKFDLKTHIRDKCLTWEEIVSLNADPLVTIGAHTVNHFPLSRLAHEEVTFELKASGQELEEKLKNPVRHFAYPFGTAQEASKREFEIARKAGYSTAVTTIPGHVNRWSHSQSLNRIFLYPLQDKSMELKDIMRIKPVTQLKQVIKGFLK